MSRKLISSASTPVASHDTINYSVSTSIYQLSAVSYSLFVHYVLDTGLHRHDDTCPTLAGVARRAGGGLVTFGFPSHRSLQSGTLSTISGWGCQEVMTCCGVHQGRGRRRLAFPPVRPSVAREANAVFQSFRPLHPGRFSTRSKARRAGQADQVRAV